MTVHIAQFDGRHVTAEGAELSHRGSTTRRWLPPAPDFAELLHRAYSAEPPVAP
ncbi:hypothetical protein [Nocardia testacea]|uniref:hypothetical protein n=1 Tax=Nocardia testacea TaxID=248551 RepID=UPI003A8811C5